MKKRLLYLLSFALLSVFALSFVSCGDDKDDTKIPKVSISDIEAASKTVTFKLTPKDAIKVEYSVTKKGDTAVPEVVDMTEVKTITVPGLTLGDTYVIRAVAISADNTKSNEVTAEFTTKITAPEVSISDIKISANSVTFKLTPKDAIKVEYSVTKKGDTAVPEVVDMTEAKVITVPGLTLDVTYVIKAAAIDVDDTKSEPVTEEFTTPASIVFHKNVLINKFTGTWCPYCPGMTTAINMLKRDIPDRVIVMAMHVKFGRTDPFEIPESLTLVDQWGINGAPLSVVDYRGTRISANISSLKNAVNKSLDDYPATSGIAIKSSVSGQTIRVKSKLSFTEAGEYKVVCAVVENELKASGSGSSDGTYHHVTRDFATDVNGLALANVVVGKEITQDFTITADSSWELDNCEVIVYIQKKYDTKFYTNNVATCGVKGSVEYAYEQ